MLDCLNISISEEISEMFSNFADSEFKYYTSRQVVFDSICRHENNF